MRPEGQASSLVGGLALTATRCQPKIVVLNAAPPRTEHITVNPLKLQRREALATLAMLAELHEVRIDSIEERPRRMSVDMHVTVSGDPKQIESFCKAIGGTREGQRRTLREWIGAVIDAF
jgi:hypothetical protein